MHHHMQAVAKQKKAMCDRKGKTCSPAAPGSMQPSIQPATSPVQHSLTVEVAVNSLQLKVSLSPRLQGPCLSCQTEHHSPPDIVYINAPVLPVLCRS
jgi:hypothetical protein